MGANVDRYIWLKTKDDCKLEIAKKQVEIERLKAKIASGVFVLTTKQSLQGDIARLKAEIAEIKLKMKQL